MEIIQRGSRLCSDKGGVVNILDFDTGEVLVAIDVPPGAVDANQYLDLASGVGVLEVAYGLSVLPPKGGWGMIRQHPQSHASGANPDYRPPAGAERLAMQLRSMIDEVRERSDHIQRREAALASIDRMPSASAAAEVEVVEPVADGQ